MFITNTKDLQMTYFALTQSDDAMTFSVDDKNFDSQEFQKQLHAVVHYVSTFAYDPIMLRIELLDKKQDLALMLNLPVVPAFLDIYDSKELSTLLLPRDNYINIMKNKAHMFSNGELSEIVQDRTNQYMNFIQHEFAGAYINSLKENNTPLAKQIRQLPVVNGFDLLPFSKSTSGKGVYKTPQFLKYKMNVEGEDLLRNYYMGLRLPVKENENENSYWERVYNSDRAYAMMDEKMTEILSILKQKYGDVHFLTPYTSSNFTDPAESAKQKN